VRDEHVHRAALERGGGQIVRPDGVAGPDEAKGAPDRAMLDEVAVHVAQLALRRRIVRVPGREHADAENLARTLEMLLLARDGALDDVESPRLETRDLLRRRHPPQLSRDALTRDGVEVIAVDVAQEERVEPVQLDRRHGRVPVDRRAVLARRRVAVHVKCDRPISEHRIGQHAKRAKPELHRRAADPPK
jgi:hypothetical protein